ncbi:MAG TPA: class I SAM-dependent methyltransferase [Ktedonobacterales bacterium]|nr:class I SAM-dependent methyltransferase [Ktedonobacterales bacterium]
MNSVVLAVSEALSAFTLSPSAVRVLVIVAVIVFVLSLALLIVFLLRQWWRKRRAGPSGPQQPMEAPELYDLRTADVNEDIRFCVEMAREVGGPVLELGAGTGRITLAVARTGLIVTGLETSRLMLQRAKMKAEQLSSKLRVEWVEGDITNFSLGGRTFKLILAPFNVLQELRDLTNQENCLRRVAEHLEPDGKFIAIVQPPRWESLKFEHHYLKTVHNSRTGEVVNFYQSLEVDPIWQKLRGTYEYEIWEQSGKMRQVIAPFEGSYLTCPEMALLLRAAKLQLEAVYGSFSRDPLTLKSRQMIFVARPLPAPPPAPAQPVALPAKQPALVGAASTASLPAVPAASAALPAAAPSSVLPGKAAADAGTAGAATLTLPPPPPNTSGTPGAPSAADASQAQGLQPPSTSPQSRRPTGSRRNTRGQR